MSSTMTTRAPELRPESRAASEVSRGYGAEDTDFGRKAEMLGIDLAWVGGARAYHQHHPVSDPPVEHLEDILRNGALYARRWGTWPMGGWLNAFEQRGLICPSPEGWTIC